MAAMKMAAAVLADPRRLGVAELFSSLAGRLLRRRGPISHLPPPLNSWTQARDAPVPPTQSFRAWWKRRGGRDE
jgi:L-lactate dehydrogenase complex protein LldF